VCVLNFVVVQSRYKTHGGLHISYNARASIHQECERADQRERERERKQHNTEQHKVEREG
jgi:hypothetical protein